MQLNPTEDSPETQEHNYTQKFTLVLSGPMAGWMHLDLNAVRAERNAAWLERLGDHPKRDLIVQLMDIVDDSDFEVAHSRADELLLEIIDNDVITEIFEAVGRWYA